MRFSVSAMGLRDVDPESPGRPGRTVSAGASAEKNGSAPQSGRRWRTEYPVGADPQGSLSSRPFSTSAAGYGIAAIGGQALFFRSPQPNQDRTSGKAAIRRSQIPVQVFRRAARQNEIQGLPKDFLEMKIQRPGRAWK